MLLRLVFINLMGRIIRVLTHRNISINFFSYGKIISIRVPLFVGLRLKAAVAMPKWQ